jgi:hypothetical protein
MTLLNSVPMRFTSYVPRTEAADYWKFESAEKRDQQLHQLVIGFGVDTGELVKTYEIHSSEDEAEPAKELTAAKLDPKRKILLTFKPLPEFAESSPFVSLKLFR